MMTLKQQQTGISFLGFIFIILVLVLVATLALRLYPLYYERMQPGFSHECRCIPNRCWKPNGCRCAQIFP